MWKFVTLTILVFLRNAVCELDQDVPPTPLVEIDDNGHADTLKYNGDEKIPIGSIVKCGMDLSEPLRINHIEGGLVGMDYSLDDVVVSNFSKCAVKSLKMDLDSLDMNIYLDCPHLSMFGKYNVTGMIIAIAFEGLGETRVDAENYGLSIKGKLEEFIGEDDQKHVKVKNFIPKSHYGGKVVYNLTNLFYGNEVLATEAHRYINGNWKAVSEFGQAPLMSAVLRPFFKNINKCLKPIPVQHIEF